MRWTHRLQGMALHAVPVIALTVASAIYLVKLASYLSPRLAPVVAQIAAETLHRQVKIARVSVFEVPGHIVLTDVAVSNSKTFAADRGLPAVTAKTIVVDYDLSYLLSHPQNVASAVKQIVVSSPTVYVERLSPGKFNFSDLLVSKTSTKPQLFLALVKITNGTAITRDDAAPNSDLKKPFRLTDIVGQIDFSSADSVVLGLSARSPAKMWRVASVKGDFLRSAKPPSAGHPARHRSAYGLDIDFKDANLAHFAPYLVPSKKLDVIVSAGFGSGNVTLKQYRAPSSAMSVSGTVAVKDGSAMLIHSAVIRGPVSGINGTASFTQDNATFTGMAELSGQKFTASGSVISFNRPQVYFEADCSSLNYTDLRKSLSALPAVPARFKISNNILVHTWISGPLSEPTIDATVNIPKIGFDSYQLKNAAADVTYGNKVLVVHSANIDNQFGADTISASGFVNSSKTAPNYHFFGQAKSIDVSRLPLPQQVKKALQPLSAHVGLVFDATSSRFEATIASTNGIVHGASYSAAEAVISYLPGNSLIIRKLFVRQKRSGILVASGSIPLAGSSSNINLKFHAAQVDLRDIGLAFSNSRMNGLAYIRGTIAGKESNPAINSHVFLLQPQFGKYTADVVTADLTGTASSLSVDKLTIRHVPGSLQARGIVSGLLTHDPRFNIAFLVRDVPVSYLVSESQATTPKSSNSFPVTGFVNGTGKLTGDLKNPVAAAKLNLADGTLQEFQLTNSSADIRYSSGIVTVDALRASLEGIAFVGSGELNPATRSLKLDANISADNLELIAQKYLPSVQISGGLLIAANVSGQLSNLGVTATLSTKDISVEGTKLSISPATFRYADDMLNMEQGRLTVSSGGASYDLDSLSLDFLNRNIDLHSDVRGETLQHILSVIQTSPYLSAHYGAQVNSVLARMLQAPSGDLAVSSAAVSGSMSHPTVSVTADLTNASLAGQSIDQLHTEFTVRSTLISFKAFHLTGPDNVYLDAKGSVDTAGLLNAKLEASGFSLSLLDPYLPKHGHATGTLSDFSLVASGETRAPEVATSITFDKPSYDGFQLDRIESGEMQIKNSQLIVNGLTFTKEERSVDGSIVDHTLDITAALPFEWKKNAVLEGAFPANAPISLTANIPEQTLDFVNHIFPDLPIKLPSGSVAGHIQVGGTLADKQVNGEFSLAGASLSEAGYETAFKNINVDLVLAGKNFTVRKFSAESNFGGSLIVAGGGQFTGEDLLGTATSSSLLADLHLNLQVTANNLIISERKIALFNNAGVSARINDGVTIDGPVMRPMVHGAINIDKVIGSLPQTSGIESTASGVPKFNPRFNVVVNIKPEAQVKTSQLNALADGSVTLAGSFYRPSIDGTIIIRKGQFFFPTATFKVVPIGTLDFHYQPPAEIREDIQLTAVTAITVSPSVLAKNQVGPNSTIPYVPTLTSTSPAGTQRYTVTVTISGNLASPDQLHLSFQSDPPGLTDSQILAELGGQQAIAGLTGGNMVSAIQDQVASVFNASVVPRILQPFEDTIGNAFGLQDFSIDYAPESPVQVTLVKRLGSRLTVQYTQSVNSRTPGAVSSTLEPPVYQVKLGYSIAPHLQLTISTDDQRNNIFAIEGIHSF
jgi:autotransporter translocation and assembly factor TamB